MPVDGMQFRIPSEYREALLRNPKLSFDQTVNYNTGVVKDVIHGSFGPIQITIYPSLIRFNFSLHKYFNYINGNGEQNYNDFNRYMVEETVSYICEQLEIDPYHSVVERLEFGVNVPVSFLPKQFLQSSLVVYKYNKPCRVNDYNYKGYFTEFKSGRHYLKVYDKGMQYDVSDHLLRVELKYISQQQVSLCNIKSLVDLYEISNLLRCKDRLNQAVQDLLITDSVVFIPKNNKDNEILSQGVNPNYWEGFITNCDAKAGRAPEQRRRRYMAKTKLLLKKYGLNKIQKELELNVPLKMDELINSNEANRYLSKVA